MHLPGLGHGGVGEEEPAGVLDRGGCPSRHAGRPACPGKRMGRHRGWGPEGLPCGGEPIDQRGDPGGQAREAGESFEGETCSSQGHVQQTVMDLTAGGDRIDELGVVDGAGRCSGRDRGDRRRPRGKVGTEADEVPLDGQRRPRMGQRRGDPPPAPGDGVDRCPHDGMQHHRPVCLHELIDLDLGRGQDGLVAPPGCVPRLPERLAIPDARSEQRIGRLAEEPRQLHGVRSPVGLQQLGGGEVESGRLGDGQDRGSTGAALVGQPPCRQMQQRVWFRVGEDRAEKPVVGVADSQRGEQQLSPTAGLLGEAGDVGGDPLPDRSDRVVTG
jgi:hypothetical protein